MSDSQITLSDLDPPADPRIEALLGHDLEVDDEVVEEILHSRGIDTENVVAELKETLLKRIKVYTEAGGHEEELKNLHFFARDMTKYQKARAPESVEPKTWIKSLLENTNKGQFPGQLPLKSLKPVTRRLQNCIIPTGMAITKE
jgi:hypothetical protein